MRTLLLLTILFLPVFASAAQMPAFPMAFWGKVTINGEVAPSDTVIRAYYGTSTLAGTVTVEEAGVYGHTNPTEQKLVVGEGDGPLTFTVEASGFNNGIETKSDTAITHNSFTSGQTIQKDLVFTIASEESQDTDDDNDSGGGGSSGGGGGGSSSNDDDDEEEEPEEEVLGAATSTDNVAELQKRLIEVLQQLISLLQLKLQMQLQGTL